MGSGSQKKVRDALNVLGSTIADFKKRSAPGRQSILSGT